MERYQEIERSLIKRFRKEIWVKFIRAINDYEMIKPNDKIAVCISGGKDSMILALCMQQLEKYGDVPFKCTYMVMNPGYNEANKQKIIESSLLLKLPPFTIEWRQLNKIDGLVLWIPGMRPGRNGS